jgi:hypothetical protein
VLEGRWKVQSIRGSVASTSAPAVLPWAAGSPAPAPTDPLPVSASGGALQASVEFRGMAEWQDISRRLSATPGVSNVDVLGLSGRSARVTFSFAGDQAQLASAVAQQGLQMRQAGGSTVISLP